MNAHFSPARSQGPPIHQLNVEQTLDHQHQYSAQPPPYPDHAPPNNLSMDQPNYPPNYPPTGYDHTQLPPIDGQQQVYNMGMQANQPVLSPPKVDNNGQTDEYYEQFRLK